MAGDRRDLMRSVSSFSEAPGGSLPEAMGGAVPQVRSIALLAKPIAKPAGVKG